MKSASPERPWLGLARFTERDREYFFGRTAEIAELRDRVVRSALTVLYGVSGYGKSSLLAAGLAPALREEKFLPVLLPRFSFDDPACPPAAQTLRCIHSALGFAPAGEAAFDLSLWEFFHDRRLPWFAADAAPQPVLIFDQFEDLFTLGEDKGGEAGRSSQDFLAALADLVENRPPAALRERLKADRELVRQYDFQSRPVKVLVALREDFLSRLERWRRVMPSVVENRVELRRLNGMQALDAIIEPSRKRSGPPIAAPETAEAIVRFVAGAAADLPLEEIENVPPLLSLVCQQLNERRFPEPGGEIPQRPDIPLEWVRREAREALSRTAADEVLDRFYTDSFAPHPPAVRQFVEDALVSAAGFRETVTLDSAVAQLSSQGVPDPRAHLFQLVDQRILVVEDRGGISRLELTHDILARLARDQRQIGALTGRIGEVRELDGNFDIPVKDKLVLIGQKDQGLPADGGSRDIRGLYADLLVSSAVAALNVDEPQHAETFLARLTAALGDYRGSLPPLVASRWKYVEASVGYHKLEFARPLALLAEAAGLAADCAGIDVEIHRGHLLLLRAKLNSDEWLPETAKVAEQGISLLKQALHSASAVLERGQRKAVHALLFALYRLQYGNRKHLGCGAEYSGLREELGKALAESRPVFREEREGDDPRWVIANAVAAEIGISADTEAGQDIDAVEEMSGPVRDLEELAARDPGNKLFIRLLGSALGNRASWAIRAKDFPQAESDVRAMRVLASSQMTSGASLRDSSSMIMLSDYRLAEILLKKNDTKRARDSLARLSARIDRPELDREDSASTDWWRYFAAVSTMKSWLGEKSPTAKTYQRAIDQARQALGALDAVDRKTGKSATQSYRSAVLNEILRYSSDDIPEPVRNEFHDETVRRIDELLAVNPNDVDQLFKKSDALSNRAFWLTARQRHAEAVGLLEEAVQLDEKAAALAPSSSYVRRLLPYDFASLAECYAKAGDWQAMLAAAEKVRQLIVAGQEKLSRELPGDWEVLVSRFRGFVDDGKKENSIVGAEVLAALEESCRRNEETAVLIRGRVLSGASDKKANLRLDLQALEIGDELKDGEKEGIQLVKQRLGWTTPPGYPAAWQSLVGTDFDEALKKLAECGIFQSPADVQRIRKTLLPCYASGELIEAEYAESSGGLASFTILVVNGKVFLLNGTSPPIHEANVLGPVNLGDSARASAYLRFFCFYVRGDEGPFRIVEFGDDIPWISTAPAEHRRLVDRLLRPVAVWPDQEASGEWRASATILYSTGMYYALFRIQPEGMVEMTADMMVAENLAINPYASTLTGRVGREIKGIDFARLNIAAAADAADTS